MWPRIRLRFSTPSSPVAVLAAIAEIESGSWGQGAQLKSEIAGDNESGPVIGFTRATLEPGEHALRGMDLRYHIRNDAGIWEVVAMERRYHCATEVATERCQ